jgi:hypothetical protein
MGDAAGWLSRIVKQSPICRQSNGQENYVSVERMRSLIQAFGSDEDAIAEVLRLTSNNKGPWK